MMVGLTFENGVFVGAELASNLQQGLAGRAPLAMNRGMLFDFRGTGCHVMWMKGVDFPLDMIFLDDKGWVVGVIADAEPRSTKQLYIDALSRYVLEVPAGFADTNRIRIGSYVRTQT